MNVLEPIEIRRSGGDLVCDWGTFINAEAEPAAGLQPLILVCPEYVAELLITGPRPYHRGGIESVTLHNGGGVESVTLHNGRKFIHLDVEGSRWTWELFAARWWDDGYPRIMVGRWPD